MRREIFLIARQICRSMFLWGAVQWAHLDLTGQMMPSWMSALVAFAAGVAVADIGGE